MKARFGIVLIASALTVSGCATVIRGTKTNFHVITEPPGAAVTTDLLTPKSKKALKAYERKIARLSDGDVVPAEPQLEFYGCDPTPCKFKVSRRAEFTVSIEKEGYHLATVDVASGFGKGGTTTATGGAAVTAMGGYVVSYSTFSLVSTLSTSVLTFGTVSSNAGVSAAATTASVGFGVIMLGIDLASGAMLDLRPNPLTVILVPQDEAAPESQTEIIESEDDIQQLIEQYRDETS